MSSPPTLRRSPEEELLSTPISEQNIPAMLERQARRYGAKPLFRLGRTEWSYAETRDAAARSAGVLRAAGIGVGDRVATMCGNRVELFELFLGCAWLGAIAVPLNTALRGAQLTHALVNSGARALVMESSLVEVLGLIDPPPELEVVWVLDGLPEDVPAGYRFELPPGEGEPLPLRAVPPGETVAIMYTSGTTGPSKGVMCPAAQWFWYAGTLCEAIGTREEDVLYNCLPLFHINALLAPIEALFAGATCEIGERFSASRYWENAGRADATVIFLLGALPNMLLAQPPRQSDREHRVKTLFAPGTAAPVWQPFMERFGVEEIVEGYGSTETNHCLGRAPGHRESRPGLMGWPFERYFEAKVVDEHDVEVQAGAAGELVLRNRFPFSFATGYWGMPEKTAEANRNLWFHTGDQAIRDEHGCFRFVDRLKDSMRRLGENISAWEVEEALVSHEHVAEAAVFPVASEETDQEVMAAIVLQGCDELDPVALVQHLEPRLAHFAIPRYIEFVESLPHTDNGKVQKAALRERGVTPTTWDRVAAGYQIRRLR
jgi:crotonobetaine/carnitine-CoA ligase